MLNAYAVYCLHSACKDLSWISGRIHLRLVFFIMCGWMLRTRPRVLRFFVLPTCRSGICEWLFQACGRLLVGGLITATLGSRDSAVVDSFPYSLLPITLPHATQMPVTTWRVTSVCAFWESGLERARFLLHLVRWWDGWLELNSPCRLLRQNYA